MPEATPPPADGGIQLCASDALQESAQAQVFDVLYRGEAVRAFVLRHEGRVVGYLNRCAHVPSEMDWQPGHFLDADRRFIICSIHGASYHPQDGRCAGGPCGRGRLVSLQVQERQGRVYWYPCADIRPLDC